MSQQILVIGEALVDCVYSHEGTILTEVPGGSPMNVAIGVSRLGHPALLAARFAKDPRGHAIAEHLAASGVSLIEKASGLERTSTASASLAADGSASYEFDMQWDLDPTMVPEGNYLHVHTGSIGATLAPGAQAVREVLQREKSHGASISYDPNARPHIMGTPDDVRDQMEAIIALSELVKASDEDIEWLYPDMSLESVVAHWQALGPDLVVVTQGASGVSAFSPIHSVVLPTMATSVVDTIGAGDSFMAGLLVALADRNLLGQDVSAARRSLVESDLREIVSFALSCAAVTVSRAGANPPTRAELAS